MAGFSIRTWRDYDLAPARKVALLTLAAGVCGIVLFAAGVANQSLAGFSRTSATALLVAGAALLVGGLLGFVFGIPRRLQQSRVDVSAGEGGQEAHTSRRALYGINTNLEQISDWLTKILVGIGLVQLVNAGPAVEDLARRLARGMGDAPGAEVFAGALALYFLIAGFLCGYIFTRLFLQGAFARGDDAVLLRQEVRLVNRTRLAFRNVDPSGALRGEAGDIAEQLRGESLLELRRVDEIAAWSKAQLSARDYRKARLGYERALRLRPDRPRLRQEYAVALARLGEYEAANKQLQKALKAPDTQADASLFRSIYEGLMYTSLYMARPRGFQRAIQYWEEFLGHPDATPAPAMRVDLVAALGQKHAWLQATHASPAEIEKATIDVLREAKAVIEPAPEWRARLRQVWEGSDPRDNDLVSLRDDRNLRLLLENGERRTAPATTAGSAADQPT